MKLERMFFADVDCPFCGDQGARGFYLCNDYTTVILLCDECSSPWRSPSDVTAENVLQVKSPQSRIDELDCGIGDGSRWATRGEIEGAGFGELIAGECEPL
jgi:hypothetical protein